MEQDSSPKAVKRQTKYEAESEQGKSSQNVVYTVTDRLDYTEVKRNDQPGRSWRVTTTELLGHRSDGNGLLVEFEALDRAERLGRMTFQWSPDFKAYRANFVSQSSANGVQVFDVHAEHACVSFETSMGSQVVLVNPSNKKMIYSPTYFSTAAVQEIVNLFEGIQEPLNRWVARQEELSTSPTVEDDTGPTIIFQQAGGGGGTEDKCKGARKTGWVKAGLILGAAIVGGIATGGALGLAIALIGGASSGVEAGDTENKHDDCKKQQEEQKE